VNPFVNLNKRSVALPSGCKDLADVLKRSESKHDSAVRRFIHLVLLQAQQDQATALIFGVAKHSAGVPIRYKVDGTWCDLEPFPYSIRADVVSGLARMAKLPEGHFPGHGVLDERYGDVRLTWAVNMTSADGESVLLHLEG